MTDSYPNLKDGAIKDFRDEFEAMEWDFDAVYNKSDNELTIDESIIQFRHISDSRKTTGKSKRRDMLYINEANKIGWDIASTYIGRTHGDIFIDYNPDFEFWAHTKVPLLKDEHGNKISQQIVLTYKDNEMCPQAEINYIESRKDNVEWYRVYGLGQTGFYSERQIYKYEFCDEIPADAKRIESGIDFGLSPDPTTLVDCYKRNNELYLDERFSMTGLMPEKIKGAERMAIVDKMAEIGFNKGIKIIADSADATAINDLKRNYYNVIGVNKSKMKVIDGINKLRGYTLYITTRSTNIKKGIESWFFKVNANGDIIPEPAGHEPDTLAAVRYVIMEHKEHHYSSLGTQKSYRSYKIREKIKYS